MRRVDDPGQQGVVIGVEYDPQYDETVVRVRFGNGVRVLAADELEAADSAVAEPWQLVAEGRLAPAHRLRALLTYERLRHPPGFVGASFGTARAKLLPYQFKPLVKFLENPRHSLLIADEVGLGKTIEGGYILREWKHRQAVETVLLVVPARLRTKWRDEMQRRFDETFELVGAADILRTLRRVRGGASLPPFQWIVSYEALRVQEVVDELVEVSPPLDFLLLDEAHRVRNRETWQYRAAKALVASSHATVFLTATPVQTSLANLHTLLDLLHPEEFGHVDGFSAQANANGPILRAASLAGAGNFLSAALELRQAAHNPATATLATEPAFRALIADLEAESAPPSRARRVELQEAISDFNLFALVFSRTRKADVTENRAVRVPRSASVDLSAAELEVYRLVAEATRELVGTGSSWGQTMAALTAFRYAASCIPAAIQWLKERLQARGALARDEGDEDDLDDEEPDAATADLRATALFRSAVLACPPPGQDSKFSVFVDVLRSIWQDDVAESRPQRKVLVFSFFRRTLDYLDERLTALGIATKLIHGGVSLPEREVRIEAFLADGGPTVLLSSEVGGEGLDLQRASVVVNYDLPWNPMVVEQRIGRIDRIGQTSPRIHIINLISNRTVEERILERLYQRVHLFESSVGEIEEILGPRQVADLVLADLRGELSAGELERRVELTAQAIHHKRRDAETLAAQAEGFLATDQALLDRIRSLVDGRRLTSEPELAELLRTFFEDNYAGVAWTGDPVTGLGKLDLPARARVDLEKWSTSRTIDVGVRRLLGEMQRGPVSFTVSADVAMNHPRAWFFASRHPIVQFAVERGADMVKAAAYGVRVREPDLPLGRYYVEVHQLDVIATERTHSLAACAIHLDSGSLLLGDEAEAPLRALLGPSEEIDPVPRFDAEMVRVASERLSRAFGQDIMRRRKQGKELTERRMARQRATREASLGRELARAREHLAAMVEKGREFAVRMAKAKLDHRARELERAREEDAIGVTYRVESRLLATVLVEVTR